MSDSKDGTNADSTIAPRTAEPLIDESVATNNTVEPQEQSFHRFGDLPTELRYMIWEQAMGPQIFINCGNHGTCMVIMNSLPALPFTVICCHDRTMSPLLRASSESRRMALSRFPEVDLPSIDPYQYDNGDAAPCGDIAQMVNYRMFNSKVDIMLVHQDELGMFWQHDLRKYKTLAVYSTMTMADNPIYPPLDNHDPRYVHTVRTWQRLVGVQQAYREITEILQEEHEKSTMSGPTAWQSPLKFRYLVTSITMRCHPRHLDDGPWPFTRALCRCDTPLTVLADPWADACWELTQCLEHHVKPPALLDGSVEIIYYGRRPSCRPKMVVAVEAEQESAA